jgi:guanylate kinase
MPAQPGPLIILSGPSGSGKSTVIARLLAEGGLPLRLSVSATTRPPRPGERDGEHYHFWTRERFEREIAAGAFLEWAEVHGQLYGTLVREVEPYRRQGLGVILVIDVEGAAQVRRRCPNPVSVFLRTSTPEALEQRLRQRHTDSPEAIRGRLETARRELARADEYDYQVINDDLETAVAELRGIIARQFREDP